MRKSILVIMVIICLGLAGVFVGLRFTEDRKGPEIKINDTELTYVEGSTYEELLEGVKAVDNKDGDVTDSLIVESVFPNEKGSDATVVYAAKDKKNNVTKVMRTVKYQKTETSADNEMEDQSDEMTEGESGQDGQDTAAANTDNATVPANAGVQTPEEDPSMANLPAGSPRIYLKGNTVTIKKGEEFNRLSYVKEIKDDKDTSANLWKKIQINGKFDNKTPGSYEQTYKVVDSDGNSSNEAKLTIVVSQ